MMSGPNPELMHLYGTDAYYLEKRGAIPPSAESVARVLTAAAGLGLFMHGRKQSDQLMLEAEEMNQRLREAETARMFNLKAGFEGSAPIRPGPKNYDVRSTYEKALDYERFKGGSVRLDLRAVDTAQSFGQELAHDALDQLYKTAAVNGDDETVELLEKLASGEPLSELEKLALMSQILKGLGGLVGGAGRGVTRAGNALFRGTQTGAGRAVSRLGAKAQGAGEKLLLRGGASPTQASRAWSGPRSLPQIPKSAPASSVPGLPKAPTAPRPAAPTPTAARAQAPTRQMGPQAGTLQSPGAPPPPTPTGVSPAKPAMVPAPAAGGGFGGSGMAYVGQAQRQTQQAAAAGRATAARHTGLPAGPGGPYRTQAPAPSSGYGSAPKPAMVPPQPAPAPARPRTGALMEGGAEAGFTRAKPGAPQATGAHREVSPWQAKGEQLQAQSKAGQEAIAKQKATAAAEAAAPAAEAGPGAWQRFKSAVTPGWKTKALLGAGALGVGYAGYKGLQTARDYMMMPTGYSGAGRNPYGPQVYHDVNQYGYVSPYG